MRSAALAIGWDLWSCQRRPLTIAAYLLLAEIPLFAAIMALSREPAAIIIGLAPAMVAFSTMLNALVYSGERAGHLGAGLPNRLFVLPLRTAELVAWPMLFGFATITLTWLYLTFLVLRPHGFAVGVLAPALAVACFIAWVQALSWSPLRNPWVNLLVTIVMLSALSGSVVALWVWLRVGSGGVSLLLIVYLTAAYGYAVLGVGRDRMGEGRGRAGASRAPSAARSVRKRPRAPFKSANQAQLWYEWRILGLGLPICCSGYLVFLIVLGCFVPTNDDLSSRVLLPIVLAIPIILAATFGGGLAKFTHFFDPKPVFPTFLAARPMTSATLVAIKFLMSALSVLLTWAVYVAFTTIWIFASGGLSTYAKQWAALTAHLGGHPALWFPPALLVLAFLTWRQYTDSLWVGLLGRYWITTASIVVILFPMLIGGALAIAIPQYPPLVPLLLRAVPWILCAVIIARSACAAAAFRLAYRRGLLSAKTIIPIILAWIVFVCALLFAALAVVPSEVRRIWVIVPAVAFVVPLLRFPASVLALDWNRHR